MYWLATKRYGNGFKLIGYGGILGGAAAETAEGIAETAAGWADNLAENKAALHPV